MTASLERPVVIVGCGRLGSAIVEGWLGAGEMAASDLIIVARSISPATEKFQTLGVRVNPGADALAQAGAVVLAVKPAAWRAAIEPLKTQLALDAVVVSVMAGVRAADMAEALAPRPVARVMPTTAVAQGMGVAAVWSGDADARAVAGRLFVGIADVADLGREDDMDAATAVAGSGPAYVHAFTRALAQAGEGAGLDPVAALRLARGVIRSAAAADADETLDALIARIASPGGTTEAGLKALNADDALDEAVEAAVTAALARARELSRG